MKAIWNALEAGPWDALHRQAAAPLQQDWAYGSAMSRIGTDTARARVVDGDRTIAIASFTIRRVGGLVGVMLCTRGPVWADEVDPTTRREVYRLLRRTAPVRHPRVALFSPEAGSAGEAGCMGMHRVMTGYSTVIVDLERDLLSLRRALDGNWRNRLNVAERSKVRVLRNGTKPSQYQWLLDREAAQRRARGYRGLPLAFVAAYQGARDDRHASVLILRAEHDRQPCAAMLFLLHGAAATYHIGWGDAHARQHGAHNLLLWTAIETLKAQGVRRLDLGGVNTGRGATLARFKLGTGGDVVRLAGTFV